MNTDDSPPGPEPELNPQVRWRLLTEAPLAGFQLAREAGLIIAWDESNTLYLIDMAGARQRQTRAPVSILQAVISDDGSQIVVAGQGGNLWWLRPTLDMRQQRTGPRQLLAMALTPFGQLLAVSNPDSHTHIYDMNGRLRRDFATNRPLKFLAFSCGQPHLIGAADYGLVGCYDIDGTPHWQDNLWSAAGHMAASGSGLCILLSCFSHGVQRYASDGTNEGAYHLGAGVSRTSLDYDGRLFAAATQETELFLVNAPGHVLWRQVVETPVRDVALDPAGRTLVYGCQSGELVAIDLYAVPGPKRPPAPPVPVAESAGADGERRGSATPAPAAEPRSATRPPTRSQPVLRDPVWSVEAFDDVEQAETCVLATLDSPPLVGVFSSRKRVELYGAAGELVCRSDQFLGVGRYLETDSGLLVAATDRELGVYDAESNQLTRLVPRFVQISHLRADGTQAEIVIVEERDRLSRCTLAGERRWTATLDSPVEGLATAPGGQTAVTTEDGHLLVFDAGGKRAGQFRPPRAEVLALAAAGSRWITLAARTQTVRCHRLDGSVEWETGIPIEAWRLYRVGRSVAARASGGRTCVVDLKGQIVLDTEEIPHEATLFADADGNGCAVFWRSGNLMVTDLSGRVRWRSLSGDPPGPLSASARGVACVSGRQLAWFTS